MEFRRYMETQADIAENQDIDSPEILPLPYKKMSKHFGGDTDKTLTETEAAIRKRKAARLFTGLAAIGCIFKAAMLYVDLMVGWEFVVTFTVGLTLSFIWYSLDLTVRAYSLARVALEDSAYAVNLTDVSRKSLAVRDYLRTVSAQRELFVFDYWIACGLANKDLLEREKRVNRIAARRLSSR